MNGFLCNVYVYFVYVIIHDLFYTYIHIISIPIQVYNYPYTCKYNI